MASATSPVSDFQRRDTTSETFHLVWLDDFNESKNEEQENTRKQLRTTINHIKTFDDVHECQKYIEGISKQERVVLLVCNRLGLEIVPCIHDLRQVSSVYVYSMNETADNQWMKTFPKVT